jgi:hypothetical protein
MRINLIKKIKIFIICFLPVISAFAENGALIRVKAEVDKSIITIGDRIIYSLRIDHDRGIKIEQPGHGANLGQFEIKDYKIHDILQRDDIITQKFEYQISVFDTGKFVIPPFPVAFFDSDTSRKFQIIQSEPIEIFVESVLTAEDKELRDIKPPWEIPLDISKWIWLAIIFLVTILGTLFGIYYYRKRKKGESLFKREKIRPAHEIAFEDLVKIKAIWREMLEAGEAKVLFTKISEIARNYLENRYFFKALEETTFEISESLQEIEIELSRKEQILNVLELSDMAKFAKYNPRVKETESVIVMMENFIENTKLIFESLEHQLEISETQPVEDKVEIVDEEKSENP